MVATPSTMMPLGMPLPPFTLSNTVDGAPTDGAALLAGRPGLLVMFLCNHCPFVVHIRSELVHAAHEALDRGLGVVAINANSLATHPEDGPEHMRRLALEEGWRFPFLFDATQEVARAFGAACTPDLYVFDASGRLAYRGRFDASTPGNREPVDGRELRAAVAAVAEGKSPSTEQIPSIGCNIKWAPA